MYFKLIFKSFGDLDWNLFLLLLLLLFRDVQLFQHQLLKWSCFPLTCLSTFIENQLTTLAWVHFWNLYALPLICVSILLPVSDNFNKGKKKASHGNRDTHIHMYLYMYLLIKILYIYVCVYFSNPGKKWWCLETGGNSRTENNSPNSRNI